MITRRLELAAFRPLARPATLEESGERSRLSGFSRQELAAFRPLARPQNLEIVEDAEPAELDGTPTERAVVASRTPTLRPQNLALPSATATTQPTQAVQRQPVPAGATVAQAATIQNGLRLNKLNLIGVYGSNSSRRALVRLSSGRFVMVEIGDRLDGGRVAGISDISLVYVKSGRNITIEVPNG